MRLLLAAAVMTALAGPVALAEDECQFDIFEHDAIEAALKAAPTCKAGVALFASCALGAGGDVSRGSIVRERCERDFERGLNRIERRAYKSKVARCWRNLKDGSMYRAMAAGCAVEVAARHSRRALKR